MKKNKNLTLAVPKGRILKELRPLLKNGCFYSVPLTPVTPENPSYKGCGMEISYGNFASPAGKIFVAWEKDAVLYLGFSDGEKNPLTKMRRKFPHADLAEDNAGAKNIGARIMKAWRGEEGGVRIALHGTPFQQKVWKEMMKIPFGKTASYGDIARALKKPTAFRAVGGAVGANPVSLLAPCHRVVQANGNVNNYAWGNEIKKKLLALESSA